MKRKIMAGIMCAFALAVSSVPTYAAEPVAMEDFEVASRVILSDGVSREAWGAGELVSRSPLLSKPEAYAKTYTYGGDAYKISAQVSVTDNNGDIFSTEDTIKTNASEVISATIVSKTSKCTFRGHHGIQKFRETGWATETTTEVY